MIDESKIPPFHKKLEVIDALEQLNIKQTSNNEIEAPFCRDACPHTSLYFANSDA